MIDFVVQTVKSNTPNIGNIHAALSTLAVSVRDFTVLLLNTPRGHDRSHVFTDELRFICDSILDSIEECGYIPKIYYGMSLADVRENFELALSEDIITRDDVKAAVLKFFVRRSEELPFPAHILEMDITKRDVDIACYLCSYPDLLPESISVDDMKSFIESQGFTQEYLAIFQADAYLESYVTKILPKSMKN